MFVDVCVNTVEVTVLSFFLQIEIPPYESRVTTAKLLIESEEYEVKCAVLVHSAVVVLFMCHGGRAA